jgi:chromosome condensin MukBEF complex kleisin-like MukF subunit
LPLDAVGHVPWWREGNRDVTLHRLLVHMVAETHRHAGHADIVRETIDGAAGLAAGNENLPGVDADWWVAYRERVAQAARDAVG